MGTSKNPHKEVPLLCIYIQGQPHLNLCKPLYEIGEGVW